MDNLLTLHQLARLKQTAIEAAQSAGVILRAYFTRQDFSVREKSDGSPVTQADKEGEALIRSHLLSNAELGPLDILGEEEGLQGKGTRWRWTVDPIDGTRSFIHGIPLFGTIIALEDTKDHRPLVGVIHLPMLGLTYAAAKGQGTTCQGRIMSIPKDLRMETAIIGIGDKAQFTNANRLEDFQQLMNISEYVRGYTDCFGHGLVISGALGAMFDPSLNPWDILATQVLIEEAGGVILLRPSAATGKVDALFGSPSLVRLIAHEISF